MTSAEYHDENEFEYTSVVNDLLANKFKDYGVFRDFETLVKHANIFYKKDEISKFHRLLVCDESRRLKNIIYSKKDQNFINLFNMEVVGISDVEEEVDKRSYVSYKL